MGTAALACPEAGLCGDSRPRLSGGPDVSGLTSRPLLTNERKFDRPYTFGLRWGLRQPQPPDIMEDDVARSRCCAAIPIRIRSSDMPPSRPSAGSTVSCVRAAIGPICLRGSVPASSVATNFPSAPDSPRPYSVSTRTFIPGPDSPTTGHNPATALTEDSP